MKSIESVRRRLDRNNPSAPPDRCYRLAKEYFRGDLRVSMHDDENTRENVRFLRKREALRDPIERLILRRSSKRCRLPMTCITEAWNACARYSKPIFLPS